MNWQQLATASDLETTIKNLQENNIEALVVETKEEALEMVKQRIPEGASVMTGSSTTLNQIGFSEYFESGAHAWRNMHQEVGNENDEIKRGELRRVAVTSDYFLASPNAVTTSGKLISADATGNRVGAMPYAAKHVLLVAGTQKIVPDIETGMQRVRDHVFHLEDKRAQAAYGVGSSINKWAIIEKETVPGRILVIFVKEELGF